MAVTYASNVFTVTPNTSTSGTGTITAAATTVTINGVVYTATQVNGVGTTFTTQLVRGSLISVAGLNDMIVYSIASNTSLIALRQAYDTNTLVISTASAFNRRAPTLWTDLVASVTATALPAIASTDARLNIAFTASSVTIQPTSVLICPDNVNMSFGNAAGYRINLNNGGNLILQNGGHITYNGNVGFSFFAGTIDCWNGRFVYQANQTVSGGRQDFFDPSTMNSHFISAMDVIVSGTLGAIQYIHLERLGGKVSELKIFNQLAVAGTQVLIQFDQGTYPGVTFPAATSTFGLTTNLAVFLARSGGTSTLVKPTFPGSSYAIANPGNIGTAFIVDEIWPDNGGAVGTLAYGGGGTTIFRQFTWNPGTYFTEGGWNVYLRDNQSTPAVVQSGVVAANTGRLLTWRRQTATNTDYFPFRLTARKAGFVGRYETFTPVAPRTENFLPQVDITYTSNQSGLSGISANNTTNTITSSVSMTLDQRYDWFQYWMALTPQMIAYGNVARVDSVDGQKWLLPNGWSDSVTAGTLSSGTKLSSEFSPTITINGTGIITAVYQDSTGTSTVLTISGFDPNSSVYVEDNNAVQKFYSANASGNITVYIPPTATGSWYYAVEKYGNQRQSDFFTFSGGQKSIVVKAIPDTGLTVLNSATVSAYTELNTPDKIYDYVAFSRLTYPLISYGQIVFKDGTALDIVDADMIVNQSASAIVNFNFTTKVLTLKATNLTTGVTYNLIKTTPPKTIEPNTDEVISVNIEDANGDSSVNIQGGSGNFTLWKIPNATSEDDYATGVNLGNVGNVNYRFLSAAGFKIVIRDNTTGFRQVVPMVKGNYTRGLFFGDQVQLAQSQEVSQINNKVDVLTVELTGIKGTGFVKNTHSLTNIKSDTKKSLKLGEYIALK